MQMGFHYWKNNKKEKKESISFSSHFCQRKFNDVNGWLGPSKWANGVFWFEIDEIGSQRKIKETKGFGSISWLKKK